jgi:hypothetical protein
LAYSGKWTASTGMRVTAARLPAIPIRTWIAVCIIYDHMIWWYDMIWYDMIWSTRACGTMRRFDLLIFCNAYVLYWCLACVCVCDAFSQNGVPVGWQLLQPVVYLRCMWRLLSCSCTHCYVTLSVWQQVRSCTSGHWSLLYLSVVGYHLVPAFILDAHCSLFDLFNKWL